MNKYILLLFIFCLSISKPIEGQTISVAYEHTPLHTVLKDIMNKTGMGYIIDADCLDQSNTITLKADNISVKEVLQKISKENNIKYRMLGKNIFLTSNARLVHGRVIDQNGEPIAGVTVHAGTLATFTNSRGEFNFRPATCDKIIKFFHSGDSATFRLGREQYITVQMKTPIATQIN